MADNRMWNNRLPYFGGNLMFDNHRYDRNVIYFRNCEGNQRNDQRRRVQRQDYSNFSHSYPVHRPINPLFLPDFDLGRFDETEEILVNIVHEPQRLVHEPPRISQPYPIYPRGRGASSSHATVVPSSNLTPQGVSLEKPEMDLSEIFNAWDHTMSHLWWKLLSPNTFPVQQELSGPNWINESMLKALGSSLRDPAKYKPPARAPRRKRRSKKDDDHPYYAKITKATKGDSSKEAPANCVDLPRKRSFPPPSTKSSLCCPDEPTATAKIPNKRAPAKKKEKKSLTIEATSVSVAPRKRKKKDATLIGPVSEAQV